MVGTGSGTFTRSPALDASCLTVVCSLAPAVPSASTFFLLSTTTPHHTLPATQVITSTLGCCASQCPFTPRAPACSLEFGLSKVLAIARPRFR